MAIEINGVLCEELVRDLSESYDLQRGPSMKKGFLCPWADRFLVAQGLLGLSTTVSVGGVITFQTPTTYPELGTAFVHAIDVEPAGAPVQGSPQIAFSHAIVWAQYHSMQWSWSGLDYMQIDPATPFVYAKQNIKFSTETITVPGKNAWLKSTGKVLGLDYGFPVAVAELEITLIRVPYLPSQQILASLQNPLNQYAFLGCDPGTVFFRGGSNEQTRDTAGNFTQDLRLVFAYRPIAAWDQAWDGTQWTQVVTSSGGSTAFLGRSDLSQLIPSYYNA